MGGNAQQTGHVLPAAGAVGLEIVPQNLRLLRRQCRPAGGIIPRPGFHQPALPRHAVKVRPRRPGGHPQQPHHVRPLQPALPLRLLRQRPIHPLLLRPRGEAPEAEALQPAPDHGRPGHHGNPGLIHGAAGAGGGEHLRLRRVFPNRW